MYRFFLTTAIVTGLTLLSGTTATAKGGPKGGPGPSFNKPAINPGPSFKAPPVFQNQKVNLPKFDQVKVDAPKIGNPKFDPPKFDNKKFDLPKVVDHKFVDHKFKTPDFHPKHGGFKNLHLTHGTKFSHGYCFHARPHYWTTRCWHPTFGCHCYWCPSSYCYYYWCAPYGCYYPIDYCPTGVYYYDDPFPY